MIPYEDVPTESHTGRRAERGTIYFRQIRLEHWSRMVCSLLPGFDVSELYKILLLRSLYLTSGLSELVLRFLFQPRRVKHASEL